MRRNYRLEEGKFYLIEYKTCTGKLNKEVAKCLIVNVSNLLTVTYTVKFLLSDSPNIEHFDYPNHKSMRVITELTEEQALNLVNQYTYNKQTDDWLLDVQSEFTDL